MTIVSPVCLSSLSSNPILIPPQRLKITLDRYHGPSNDSCEICDAVGDLLCCDFCNLVYHTTCLNMAAVPRGDFMCKECTVIEKRHQDAEAAARQRAR